MRYLLLAAMAGLFASCAGTPKTLEVKQFVLRDAKSDANEDPMIRGEKLSHLYGAISVADQKQRLGQYYTVLWHDASGGGPAELVFRYQQGASGSLIKTSTRKFDPAATAGKAEFSIIGDNFTKGGRVLAWRVALIRGGHEIASQRSYLWR